MLKKFIQLFFISTLLLGCREEEIISERNYPFIKSLQIHSIDNTGASFDFEIIKTGNGNISSYGVEFREVQANFNFGDAENYKIVQQGAPTGNLVSFRITHDLVNGVEYLVLPFVRSGDRVVYGDALTFTSKGGRKPEITGVSTNLIFGDMEFTIMGNYFSSRKEGNIVEIPGLEQFFRLEVLSSTNQEIRVKMTRRYFVVADFGQKYSLKLTVAGQSTFVVDHFTMSFPVIGHIDPLRAHVGKMIQIGINDEFGQFDGKAYFNYNGFPSAQMILSGGGFGQYMAKIPNIQPGSYEVSILGDGSYLNTYPEKFEVLNSWKVYQKDISLTQLESYTKMQAGDRVLFLGDGGWIDIYAYDFLSNSLQKLKEFPGISTGRFGAVRTVGEERYFYYGLGYRYGSNKIELLKDFRRLDLVNNVWEELPDFPMEKTEIVNAFEFQGNIVVIPANYGSFFVFDVNTKTWRQSAQSVPLEMRHAVSLFVYGNEVYFLLNNNGINIYRYRVGELPVLYRSFQPELTWDRLRKPQLLILNDIMYVVFGTSDIYKLYMNSDDIMQIQSVFESINSDVLPLITSQGLMLAFPPHPAAYGDKNIIYQLDLEEE